MAMLAYRLLLWLALPWVVLRLFWRGLQEPAYASRRLERFGQVPQEVSAGGIWVHSVSAGETIATAPLVEALLQRDDTPVLVTTMTPTGSEQVHRLLGGRVQHCYAPYDFGFAVERFLDRTRPRAVILMETEIWPNLVLAARRRKIPVMLLNARLSERSARGYRRVSWLVRRVLPAFTAIGCQSEAHRQRFIDLGADPACITTLGNIKFDLALAESIDHKAQEMGRLCHALDRPILMAASTHPGEERQVIEAYRALTESMPNLYMILAPRHPHRVTELTTLLTSDGFAVSRFSQIQVPASDPGQPKADILIIDQMGVLLPCYRLAHIAFVGVSLVPHGGHNPIEPAALGTPIVTGPHNFNFAQVHDALETAGAIKVVNDAQELAQALGDIFSDGVRQQEMGAAGVQVVEENRGAVERYLTLLTTALSETPRR